MKLVPEPGLAAEIQRHWISGVHINVQKEANLFQHFPVQQMTFIHDNNQLVLPYTTRDFGLTVERLAGSNALKLLIAILKILCTVRGAEPPRASLQTLEIRQDSTPFGTLRLRTAPGSERFCISSFLQIILHLAIGHPNCSSSSL